MNQKQDFYRLSPEEFKEIYKRNLPENFVAYRVRDKVEKWLLSNPVRSREEIRKKVITDSTISKMKKSGGRYV